MATINIMIINIMICVIIVMLIIISPLVVVAVTAARNMSTDEIMEILLDKWKR